MKRKYLKLAISDIVRGIRFRYPLCCVANFAWDSYLRGREELPYGRKTLNDYEKNFHYVKCWWCSNRERVKNGKQSS